MASGTRRSGSRALSRSGARSLQLRYANASRGDGDEPRLVKIHPALLIAWLAIGLAVWGVSWSLLLFLVSAGAGSLIVNRIWA